MLLLNQRAHAAVAAMLDARTELRIAPESVAGARIVDCGAQTHGGLEAGRRLAEISLGGLGSVSLSCEALGDSFCPIVTVYSDHPVAACMASQYAGWELKAEDFFAMGSGPMRAAYGGEALFDSIGFREKPSVAVGVLETSTEPTAEVVSIIAQKCCVAPQSLALLYAPVDCQAGAVQVVARSLETALHKLFELGFDLSRVESGMGRAPLPPVAGDMLTGIGRTNDAILYGGHVSLWVRGDDASLAEIITEIPSCTSRDHGRPFKEVFKTAGGDFYSIDKLLFSPALVTLTNLDTGRTHKAGRIDLDILNASFFN